MIEDDPSAPFTVGCRVRLLNGPVMTVLKPLDEDNEILCGWWDAELGKLCWVYAPEALLVHAMGVPMTTDPDYIGDWRQRSLKAKPQPKPWTTRVRSWLLRNT